MIRVIYLCFYINIFASISYSLSHACMMVVANLGS